MKLRDGLRLIVQGLSLIDDALSESETLQTEISEQTPKECMKTNDDKNDESPPPIKKEVTQDSWSEKMQNLLHLTKRKKDEGFTEEIRMVMRKHNIRCLSEVTEEQYQDVFDDICGL